MAIGTLTRGDVLTLFKEVFIRNKEVADQFEQGTVMHDLVDSGTDVTQAIKVEGRNEGKLMILMQRTKAPRNSAVGYKSGDSHPRPGKSTYRRANYQMAHMSTSFSFDDIVALTGGGGEQSVDDILSIETDAHISANRKRLNIAMLGNAHGRITSVGDDDSWAESTKILKVLDASGIEIGDEIIMRLPQAGGLSTGTIVATWPKAGGTTGQLTPALVSAKDDTSSPNTITLTRHDGTAFVESDGSTAFGTAEFDDAGIYPFDSQSKYMWGLKDFCSAVNSQAGGFDPAAPATLLTTDDLLSLGILGGIDRVLAGNADWKALSFTAAALGGVSQISVESHIKPLLNRISKQTGGDVGWLLGITGFDVSDGIASDLARQNRTNFRVKLDDNHGGFHEAVQVRNLFIIVDVDADFTQLNIFEPDAAFRVIGRPWQLDQTTGDTWNRERDEIGRGKPEFTGYWVTSQQLGMSRILGCAELTALTASL